MATKKTPKSPAKIPAAKAPKAKKTAKVKAAKLAFYSTAGRVLKAAQGKQLARGTYAHLGVDGAQALRGLKIRIGTAKGTVYEGSALDFIKTLFSDRGLKLDVNANSRTSLVSHAV